MSSAPGPLTRVPPAPPAAPAAPAAKTELIDAVRHWVHFDNLAESLQKQVTNARSMRNTFEERILNYLDTTAMRGAILQITGATLQKATRPKTTDLSWSFLESNLHDFYKSRGRPDETAALIEFLQSRRDIKQIPYLKKTTT
jgi:hypothetical protein